LLIGFAFDPLSEHIMSYEMPMAYPLKVNGVDENYFCNLMNNGHSISWKKIFIISCRIEIAIMFFHGYHFYDNADYISISESHGMLIYLVNLCCT